MKARSKELSKKGRSIVKGRKIYGAMQQVEKKKARRDMRERVNIMIEKEGKPEERKYEELWKRDRKDCRRESGGDVGKRSG